MTEGSFTPRNLGQTKGILLQADKLLTASYANFGSEIDVRGYNTLGVWVDADVNSSENVTLKALAYYTSGGTAYELETNGTKSLWTTGASDFTKLYEFDISTINYIQLQAIAGTLGVTPAYLTGGTSAQSTAATWEAVTDGEFAISIDGTAYDITGIDFTGDSDMDDVAATIQAAIRAETGNEETVTWSTDHFIISSALYGPTSAITVTSTVSGGTGTDISGAGAADWLDADATNGTVTAVSGTVGSLEIYITLSGK